MVKVTPTAGQNPQSRALGLSKESATLVWNFIINEAFAEAGFDAEKESFGPHEKPTPGSTMQRVIDSTVAKFPDLFKPDELTKDCLAKLASLVRRACQAPKRKVSVIQAVLRNKIQREMETAARTKRTHNEMLGGEEDAEETSAVATQRPFFNQSANDGNPRMHQGSLESAATNPSNVGNSTFTSTANSGTFTPGANDNSTAITNTEFLEMCDANNESAPSVASGSSQSQNASTPQPQAESNDAKSPSELSEADTSGTDESGSDTEYFPPLAGATLSEVRAEKYLIEDRIERLYRKSSEYEGRKEELEEKEAHLMRLRQRRRGY